MWGGEWNKSVEVFVLFLQSKLSCYWLKVTCYKIFFCKPYGNYKTKPAIDMQKIKSKESKHTTRENHLITKKVREE